MTSLSRKPLSEEAIRQALEALDGWTFEGDRLVKRFSLGDFSAAVAFFVRVALEAEKLDHHPDVHNVHSTIDIALNTHDAGGKVTEMDVELARRIDRLWE